MPAKSIQRLKVSHPFTIGFVRLGSAIRRAARQAYRDNTQICTSGRFLDVKTPYDNSHKMICQRFIKLVRQRHESAIVNVTENTQKEKNWSLGQNRVDLFRSDPCMQAWNRISKYCGCRNRSSRPSLSHTREFLGFSTVTRTPRLKQ